MNNIFLGNNNDPLLNSSNIQDQLNAIEAYKNKLLAASQNVPSPKQNSVWIKIDDEVSSLTANQQQELFKDPEYAENAQKIQGILQAEYLNAMMPIVEKNPEGRKLLEMQYDLVKVLKKRVIESSNKEMELFKKFQEYSKSHPNTTYEEFVKTQK